MAIFLLCLLASLFDGQAKEKPVFRVWESSECVWCQRLKTEVNGIRRDGMWRGVQVEYARGGPPPYPQVDLIDPKGNVRHQFTGYRSRSELIRLVEKHLGER